MSAHPTIPALSVPITTLRLTRSISGGISRVMIPGAIGPAHFLVSPMGVMMTDNAARTCPKEPVSNEMPGDAAD